MQIYTQYDVQEALLARIMGLMNENSSLMRELFGPQKIYDALRLLYWYTPDRNSLGRDPIIHPITKSILGMFLFVLYFAHIHHIAGQRPEAAKVFTLREVLFSILRLALLGSPAQSVPPPSSEDKHN